MDAGQIFKTFLKIAGWIAGFVIAPLIAALGLSKAFGWDWKVIILWAAGFYVMCFLVTFLGYVIKDYIKKEVHRILKEEKIMPKKKK